MYFKIKNSLFSLLKYFGVFRLFRFFNRHKIPVLCYHGVSTQDEHLFMPSNFIRFKTFKERIEILKKKNYKFITLDAACEMVKNKKIDKNCVVLTIDDAFVPIFDELIPYCIDSKLPITCYVTTYKSMYEIPIFRLVTQYFFWSKPETQSNFEDFGKVDKSNYWDFIKYAEANYSREQRVIAAEKIAQENNIDYNEKRKLAYSIATKKTLNEFGNKGLDIQLHTHYHNMNLSNERLDQDFQINKDYLSESAPNKLEHFCYPSGVWNQDHFPLLEKHNIKSATTCDPGLMNIDTHLYKIPRIIDSDAMSSIVFESEICGFNSWLRKLLKK